MTKTIFHQHIIIKRNNSYDLFFKADMKSEKIDSDCKTVNLLLLSYKDKNVLSRAL